MKLSEYITHLQDIEANYPGLDIEVVQRHPSSAVSNGALVVAAEAPEVMPVEIEPSRQWIIRRDATRHHCRYQRNRPAPAARRHLLVRPLTRSNSTGIARRLQAGRARAPRGSAGTHGGR
jgi:hypothetical protein